MSDDNDDWCPYCSMHHDGGCDMVRVREAFWENFNETQRKDYGRFPCTFSQCDRLANAKRWVVENEDVYSGVAAVIYWFCDTHEHLVMNTDSAVGLEMQTATLAHVAGETALFAEVDP